VSVSGNETWILGIDEIHDVDTRYIYCVMECLESDNLLQQSPYSAQETLKAGTT
jgi:hypothetical protein